MDERTNIIRKKQKTVKAATNTVEMIFNFFALIFRGATYKSSEIITTTIAEIDPNIVVDEDDVTISSTNCYSMDAPAVGPTMSRQRELDINSSPSTAKLTTSADGKCERLLLPFGGGEAGGRGCGRDLSVQFQQQTNHKTNQTNDMNNARNLNHSKASNELSACTVYTLFASFFICICTIAVLLMAYVNRVNDIAQLRTDLNGQFVGRDDIDVLVRNILHEFRINDDGVRTFKPR